MENNQINQLPPPTQPPVENKKMLAGLSALLLGGFGVHKFVLGYKTEGIILVVIYAASLVLTIITCGFAGILTIPLMSIVHILTMIEGIIYLTKSDEEFYQTYQVNKKAWF